MPAIPLRIPTNVAEYAPIYSLVPRAVVSPEDIAPRLPGAFFGGPASVDYAVPQLLYCENVMPTAKGLYSVGYQQQVAPITPATTACDRAINLRDINENLFLFVPAGGKNYIYDPLSATWTSSASFAFTNVLITRGYVNGRTIICYEKTKIIEYSSGTGAFVDLTPTLTLPAGLTMAQIRGIGAASNYLLLFSDITIYWCTPGNILDFATVDQGAGAQTPIDIKGAITALIEISGGFIIYTVRNAIAAFFTNNGNSPFALKEINNCGGVSSWENVATEAAPDGTHYAWTTIGLQKVTLQGAESTFPEITDAFVGCIYESWNSTTKQVVSQILTSPVSTKLAFVLNRFLVISFGQVPGSYTGAFIFDDAFNRWGKAMFPHVDVFSYPYPAFLGSLYYNQLLGFYADIQEDYAGLDSSRITVALPKRGISFLQPDGSVYVMSADFTNAVGGGVAIFGHLQHKRSRTTTVHLLEFEGLSSNGGAPVITVLPSLDGKNRASPSPPAPATLIETNGAYSKYAVNKVGMNHDIVIESRFVLSEFLARISNHGYR